jgi:outer membrane PBP1 activator LpoA protein
LLNEADKINYYQSLAFAYSLTGNVIQGVTARIRLGNLLQNPQQQQDNVIAIMDMLNTLSIDALSVPQSSLDDLNGWMELAKIFKQRDQPGFNLDNQIAQWRQHYPSHPANPEFLKTYLTAQPAETPVIPAPAATAPTAPSAAGPTIAVLLPQTGALAQAGKALQDGILAAQQLAARSAPQPPLKFYDTEQNEIVTLYKQALADGAKQVIGPLVKEQIQVLADAVVFDVPVLALNHVEDLIKPNLYQFGLSPIDEAGQLALKAAKDGRKTASILTPDTSQGQRISQYLTIAWQSNGGLITGMQSYDPKQHDIADMLNALLGSTSITAQQGQPQTVFLSAFPDVAHELALQLKSRQNSDLAIYAMPNIYSGRPDPLHDADLGNINFCDIPWFFADYYKGPLNQTALQANWERLTDTQIRLLALGIDAYNILGRLTELQNSVYEGATGHLSLDSENRVTRKLVCAQFKGGIPAATGFIE